MENTCKKCKYYKSTVEDLYNSERSFGECRRHSPRTVVAGCGVGENPYSENDWAIVEPNDWCGDFEVTE